MIFFDELMLFCRDFCGILVRNIGGNIEKWNLSERFLNVYGTKCIVVSDEELIKYSKKGKIVVVKWLWSKGADVTARDNYAVRWASREGYLEVVKFLVSKGADITTWDNYAVRLASRKGHLNVVKFLVSKDADITADNNCAVRWASREGHLDVVEFLVSKGAKLE